MGCASQFPSPTFLFSHAVTSSNHVAQEKIISWNQFFFLLEVNFQQKTMIQSSIGFFYTTLINLKKILLKRF